MTWRTRSEAVLSAGRLSARASSLGDLHRRRAETAGQFFSPTWVARGIWSSLAPLVAELARDSGAPPSVLDTSVGSGRLLEGAPVDALLVHGVDVDARCIEALSRDASRAGFRHRFEVGSLADLRARHHDFVVINPPFSVQLQSPVLEHLPGTRFGRYGPHTAATSHEHALQQGVRAGRWCVAVLPASMEAQCIAIGSLRAVVSLPRDAFAEEAANVAAAVFFFGPGNEPVHRSRARDERGGWPAFDVSCLQGARPVPPTLRFESAARARSGIVGPVTGDPTVTLHHHNRRIVLHFACALVEARVRNALLVRAAVGVRLPKSIRYAGDGAFLIDALLAADDPASALDRLCGRIESSGGAPVVSSTLAGFYRKALRRLDRETTPLRHVIRQADLKSVQLVTRRRMLLDPADLSSPPLRRGIPVEATVVEDNVVIEHEGRRVSFTLADARARFEGVDATPAQPAGASGDRWVTLHEGLASKFPAQALQWHRRLLGAGVTWLEPFQSGCVVEGAIRLGGFIGGWEQGGGKSRGAVALALILPGSSLIVVESGLLFQMLLEIRVELGVDESVCSVLEYGEKPRTKVSVMTYESLRKGVAYRRTVTDARGNDKVLLRIVRTGAQLLRRAFTTVLADEADILSNPSSQTSRSVRDLAARKLVLFTGTPIRNYPTDLLPLAVACAGNARVGQPFGVGGAPYISRWLAGCADGAERGEDVFFNRHVVTEWVTREYREGLRDGAKRVVPKIARVERYRDWQAPFLQRLSRDEPGTSAFANCPPPERRVIEVPWDAAHLEHYLTVAEDFAHWYASQRRGDGGTSNLSGILARVRAVQRAANSPHVEGARSMGLYAPDTSKQRAVVEHIASHVASGRKTILYAESPAVIDRLHARVTDLGIGAVRFTGKQNTRRRALELDERFRSEAGDADVLLSTFVGQRGWNLECAEALIFYERNWSATAERQAVARTQRSKQRARVLIDYFHLEGSIDCYQAQMVAWKGGTIDSAIDHAPEMPTGEFLHMNVVLERFCASVLKMEPEALFHLDRKRKSSLIAA